MPISLLNLRSALNPRLDGIERARCGDRPGNRAAFTGGLSTLQNWRKNSRTIAKVLSVSLKAVSTTKLAIGSNLFTSRSVEF